MASLDLPCRGFTLKALEEGLEQRGATRGWETILEVAVLSKV